MVLFPFLEFPLSTKMATAAIGFIGQFGDTKESWESYNERREQYFIANKIKDNSADGGLDDRVPALLSIIGGRTYSLLRALTAPEKPATKSFDDLVKLLKGHLSPKPLIIAERFRFHKRDQRSDETVREYVVQIRKLSENCEFGTHLQDSMRDCLVCGLHNTDIQKKLLTEDKLTFEKSVDISTAMETAAKDALELQNKAHVASGVNKVSSGKPPRKQGPKPKHHCFHCNKGGHDPEDLYFKTKSAEIASVRVTLREHAKRHRPIIGPVEVLREKRTL